MPPTQMPPARSRGVGWCELRAPAVRRGPSTRQFVAAAHDTLITGLSVSRF